MEILILIMAFLTLLASCASLTFTVMNALVTTKTYELLKSVNEKKIPDYKQEIPLESPTYPLRLR